ncbi:MAG: toll/interleukin-1 receptor domain-containing protein [Anaerolineae bacterium]|nr:MAG: toll/interleukin-1 receptor domain-containing protein [Anaerolineae bacterium]
MKPKIFFSYSRREAPFVNDLTDQLEDNGYPVWLDYRSMAPGKPWAEQIEAGIRESDVILLVVSDAAMASKWVEKEWRSMLTYNKRVILILFEANALPPELEGFEWVDFRGNYKKALAELFSQLDTPQKEETKPPAQGFKVPAIVWAAFALSVLVALFSLPTIWTVITALYLLPLPYRILKRDFDYARVQASLFLLPLAFLVTSDLFATDAELDWLMYDLAYLSVLPAAALWLVLRSRGMQRWGKPEASRPRFANPATPPEAPPQPVKFLVEHAPEDGRAAKTLAAALVRHGHMPVEAHTGADTVLTVVSTYNKVTAADPQRKVVIPIVLDNTLEIDPNLQKMQWIDFRRGLTNLDALAKLLCTPTEMLKALGIMPTGNQMVMPAVMQYMVYFLGLLGLANVAGWVPYFIQFADDIAYTPGLGGMLFLFAVLMAVFLWLVVAAIRALTSRRGRLASIWGIVAVFALLGIILFIQLDTSFVFEEMIALDLDNDMRGMTGGIGFELYSYGTVALAVFAFIKRQDLLHWLPLRRKA